MPQRDRRTIRRDVHIGRAGPALLLAAAAVIGGCGSDESPTPETERIAEPDGVLVAALGDSITAGSPAYDPDPAARARLEFGDDQRSQFEYWAERKRPRLAFRNCGVFGERTDEIAARLGECTQGARVLVVQGGINDIAQGRPVADAAADLRATVTEGEELGLEVAIADVLPWNNGHPAADGPIAELNRLIAGIARDEDVILLEFHDALEDPSAAGLMAPELTSDGDHPSITGYRLLGELVARELGSNAGK